jgi:hypothetical protein
MTGVDGWGEAGAGAGGRGNVKCEGDRGGGRAQGQGRGAGRRLCCLAGFGAKKRSRGHPATWSGGRAGLP